MTEQFAYCDAVAFESAGDLPYDPMTGQYVLPPDVLEYYARLVAYKVAYNISNGFRMNPNIDPLEYVNCGDNDNE